MMCLNSTPYKTQQDPVGPSWVQKPSRVPGFWFVGKRFQPPRASLSSKGQIQIVTDWASEGMQKQRKGSQETTVQL